MCISIIIVINLGIRRDSIYRPRSIVQIDYGREENNFLVLERIFTTSCARPRVYTNRRNFPLMPRNVTVTIIRYDVPNSVIRCTMHKSRATCGKYFFFSFHKSRFSDLNCFYYCFPFGEIATDLMNLMFSTIAISCISCKLMHEISCRKRRFLTRMFFLCVSKLRYS